MTGSGVIPGVYVIENTKNRRKYIGESENVFNRLRQHMMLLGCGSHYLLRMQKDYERHGQTSFRMSVLEVVPNRTERYHREQERIAEFKPMNLYNYHGAKIRGKRIWYTDDAAMCDCGGFCEVATGCVLCGKDYDDLT